MNNNLKESALHYLSSPAFNKNTLVDITEIHVRSESDGSIGVHVTYSGNTGDTLQRRIHNLLISEN